MTALDDAIIAAVRSGPRAGSTIGLVQAKVRASDPTVDDSMIYRRCFELVEQGRLRWRDPSRPRRLLIGHTTERR